MFGCSRRARICRSAKKRWRASGLCSAGADDLDGDVALVVLVLAAGEIDGAHAAVAEPAQQAVGAERVRASSRPAAGTSPSSSPAGRSRKVALACVRGEELLHRPPQLGVPRAGAARKASRSSAGRSRASAKRRVDLPPAVRLGSSLRPGVQLLVEPRLGPPPFAADRLGRDAELRGGLLQRQAAEEPELHHRGLARIDRLQALPAPRPPPAGRRSSPPPGRRPRPA